MRSLLTREKLNPRRWREELWRAALRRLTGREGHGMKLQVLHMGADDITDEVLASADVSLHYEAEIPLLGDRGCGGL